MNDLSGPGPFHLTAFCSISLQGPLRLLADGRREPGGDMPLSNHVSLKCLASLPSVFHWWEWSHGITWTRGMLGNVVWAAAFQCKLHSGKSMNSSCTFS